MVDYAQPVRLVNDTGAAIAGMPAGSIPTSDVGMATSWGVAGLPFNSADASAADVAVSDAPGAGLKLVVSDIIFSVGTTMTVTFKEETSGTVIYGPFYALANTTTVISVRAKGKKLPVANKKLMVRTSVAGNITVSAAYYPEA
jgi:hypothetical protein